jgi:sigma-E factor negative regulatory protein RseA
MVMDRISAFMDGESGQAETRQAILRLKHSDDYCENWEVFHLIGDTLRGEPALRDDFMARFHARIEHEPTQLAPRVTWRKSANYALSAAASLAGIFVVGMLVLSDNPLKSQAQIAAVPAPAAPAIASVSPLARPLPAANQGKVNEYLMAHQEFSPSTAFQGVAPYVRTVSETHDGSSGR